MGAYFEHEFSVERVGARRHGQGGKVAATRWQGTCRCGYSTKWRKFQGALEEDIEAHLSAAEAIGEQVSRRRRILR